MPEFELPDGEKIKLPYTKEGIEAAENIENMIPEVNAQDRVENYQYGGDVVEELPPVEGLEAEGEGVLGESPLVEPGLEPLEPTEEVFPLEEE